MGLGVLNDSGDGDSYIQAGIRDCFHVPCVMAVAGLAVRRGQPVRFKDQYFDECLPCDDVGSSHGFADPFVANEVIEEGVRFWVLLKPGLVRNVRHGFEVNDTPYEGYDGEIDTSCRGCNN